jgi:hypothetical protein
MQQATDSTHMTFRGFLSERFKSFPIPYHDSIQGKEGKEAKGQRGKGQRQGAKGQRGKWGKVAKGKRGKGQRGKGAKQARGRSLSRFSQRLLSTVLERGVRRPE